MPYKMGMKMGENFVMKMENIRNREYMYKYN